MLVVVHEAVSGQWLRFENAVALFTTRRREEVVPLLRAVEERVQADNLWAAGFVSYEAAPAFDAALQAHAADDFPLVCFGLYPPPRPLHLPLPVPRHPAPLEWRPSITREEYNRAIAHIKACIARGETYQVNFSLRLFAPFADDPWAFFLLLARAQESSYSAYVDAGRYVICSASPELFFRLDGSQITTRPMKGTAARGKTLAEDLAQARWLQGSDKNRAENVMIVDMLRNDLGRIAERGSVNVAALFEVERYPTLWQMTSTITASSQASLSEILTALFPSASVTGAPKVRTMSMIATTETLPRHIYTGCIGFLAPRRYAQFNVAIRTVLIDRQKQQAEYGVGGGVVWDSSSTEEYAECQTKTRLLTDVRPEFALLEAVLWTPRRGYFLLPYHLRRLHDSAAYFGYPLDMARVHDRLNTLAASLPPRTHKVRLLLDRYGAITCEAIPLARIPRPARPRLRLADQPVNTEDVFLYHKTTHRLVYDHAARACAEDEEILLWNERGEITETSRDNVVVRWHGRLYTPPVSCGLLAGTFRAWLLESGKVEERVLSVSDLDRCEKIYLVNSVRRWREAIWISAKA